MSANPAPASSTPTGVTTTGPSAPGSLVPSLLIQRHPPLDMALRRLSGALDLLEAASVRFERAETDRRDLDDTLAAMEDDRNRLAEELDAALRGRAELAVAAAEVAARLRSAGTALRGLMGEREAGSRAAAEELKP